jgi:hypothetical protein
MGALFLAAVLCGALAFPPPAGAQPVLDGSFEGTAVWGEPVASNPAGGWEGFNATNLYVTTDDDYVYLGAQSENLGDWKNFGFILNLDPASGGVNDPWGRQIVFAHADGLPDFAIRGEYNGAWAEFRDWAGGNWDTGGGVNVLEGGHGGISTSFVEFRVPRERFGGASSFQVQFFVSGNNAGEHGTFDAIPQDEVMTSWNHAGNPTTLQNYATVVLEEDGAPVATFIPSVEDGISATVAPGGMTTESFAIMNTGDEDLVFSIDIGAMLRDQHDGDLDEAFEVEDFTVVSPANGGTPVNFTLPAGVATSGTVVGFSFEGTVAGITGNSTWASDLQMTITSPAGESFTVGGFPSEANWDFNGSVSDNDGTYTSTHFGAFGEDGTPDAGDWQVAFVHGWNSTAAADMDWSNVTITLHKVGEGEPPVGSFIAGVSPMAGTVAPGSTETVTVTFDAEGFDEGTYMDYLTITTNEAMDTAALPLERRETMLATRGMLPTTYQYPVEMIVEDDGPPPADGDLAFNPPIETGLKVTLDAGETGTGQIMLTNTGDSVLEYVFTQYHDDSRGATPTRPPRWRTCGTSSRLPPRRASTRRPRPTSRSAAKAAPMTSATPGSTPTSRAGRASRPSTSRAPGRRSRSRKPRAAPSRPRTRARWPSSCPSPSRSTASR